MKCYFCRKHLPEPGTDYIILARGGKYDPVFIYVCAACLKSKRLMIEKLYKEDTSPLDLPLICPSPG